MDRVRVTIIDGPIDTAGVPESRDCGCGAVVTFLGVVRGDESGTPIDALEYTTYDPMAERVLDTLARDAVERFGVRAVFVEHSRGRVGTGECSFRLVVAGAHRRETLDATDWFIERMKRDAPIWKKPIPAVVSAATGGVAR